MSAMLQTPLPALDDREGKHVPKMLPAVIDAHVHLFPDHLFESIWQWFEKYGWPIRYRLKSAEVIEFDFYRRLLERYDNLWLDTTMALADYLPFDGIPDLAQMRADRLIFGSDFPNLPYAWDRELRRISRLKLDPQRLSKLLSQNAVEFYAINTNALIL